MMRGAKGKMMSKGLLLANSMLRGIVAPIILLIAAAPAYAAQGSVPGAWYGALDTPSGVFRILIEVEQNADDALSGTLESLDQSPGQKNPLSSVHVDDETLNFAISQIGMSYEASWNDEDGAYRGVWSQSGQQFNLTLERLEDEAELSQNRPQYPQDPLPYRVEEAVFANVNAEGVLLAGTLTRPNGSGPYPLAILITGSGPQDRDEFVFGHKPFLVLADHLTRSGIAVLRYDDRGYGASTGNYSLASTNDFVSDALAAVDYITSRSDIEISEIGLIGHSEGGLIAPMAAQETDEIDFLVLLAAPGIPTREILLTQARDQALANGAREEDLVIGLQIKAQIMAIAAAPTSYEEAAVQLREMLTDDALIALGGTPSIRDEMIRSSLSTGHRSLTRQDPEQALTDLQIPVLALNGALDVQVDAEVNLDGIRLLLVDSPDATIQELPGLNHMFQTAKTGAISEYAQIDETFAPHALDLISEWIAARYETVAAN